jgi:large subunit ribosomal protein L31e
MAEENKSKIVLEREYVVPLRTGWLKVPMYKRAKKAVKTLKEFMVKHMKVYDRDLRKIKVDIYLNNEIRFKGMKKPLHKVNVKAIKYDDGTVVVKLVTLPKHLEFEVARKARKAAEMLNKSEKPATAEKVEKKEESVEAKEKKESSKLAEEKIEKDKAKQEKHTSKTSQEEKKFQRIAPMKS